MNSTAESMLFIDGSLWPKPLITSDVTDAPWYTYRRQGEAEDIVSTLNLISKFSSTQDQFPA